MDGSLLSDQTDKRQLKLKSKERLYPTQVARLAKTVSERTHLHHDGGGLYLAVDKRGAREDKPGSANWVYRYSFDGKARTMGLGSYPDVGLADARRLADEARRLKALGEDPLQHRDAKRASKRLEAAKAMTFKQCAEAYVTSHQDGWSNAKHAEQWRSTLNTYAYPLIGDLPVSAIDVGLVMQVLEQEVPSEDGKTASRLWVAKNETASRLRGRIEAVLGWAASRNLRSVDNPARWKGQLQHQLPARRKVKTVKAHRALPFAEIGGFLKVLRRQEGAAARALEFLILTAARTGEVLGATWGEIDQSAKAWVIPAERMKGRKHPHRVPLTADALAILDLVKPNDPDPTDFVFPGSKPGRPLSNMAFLMLLRRMKRDHLTAHGFRATFRMWGAELTDFSPDLLEKALSHTVGDETRQAYDRGDLFERRRAVMDTWSMYCAAAA